MSHGLELPVPWTPEEAYSSSAPKHRACALVIQQDESEPGDAAEGLKTIWAPVVSWASLVNESDKNRLCTRLKHIQYLI